MVRQVHRVLAVLAVAAQQVTAVAAAAEQASQHRVQAEQAVPEHVAMVLVVLVALMVPQAVAMYRHIMVAMAVHMAAAVVAVPMAQEPVDPAQTVLFMSRGIPAMLPAEPLPHRFSIQASQVLRYSRSTGARPYPPAVTSHSRSGHRIHHSQLAMVRHRGQALVEHLLSHPACPQADTCSGAQL